MRFLGGKWQKKNNGQGNGRRFSEFGFRFFAALPELWCALWEDLSAGESKLG
jgi:hypothetical protein